jgi:hypothetical protein
MLPSRGKRSWRHLRRRSRRRSHEALGGRSCHPDLTIGLIVRLNIIPLQLQQPLLEPNPIDCARSDLAERDDGGSSPSGDTRDISPRFNAGAREAEKRALDLIEMRGLVPFRYVLLARERKQVLVLGPAGERLPLADDGQIRIVRPLVRRAEHSRRIARPKSGVSNRDAVTPCAETGT